MINLGNISLMAFLETLLTSATKAGSLFTMTSTHFLISCTCFFHSQPIATFSKELIPLLQGIDFLFPVVIPKNAKLILSLLVIVKHSCLHKMSIDQFSSLRRSSPHANFSQKRLNYKQVDLAMLETKAKVLIRPQNLTPC